MTRLSTITLWSTLLVLSTVLLYSTSNRVHTLQTQLRSLNASIAEERNSIHVLKAEWVYVANPARIGKAAQNLLGMKPTDLQHIAGRQDLADRLPTRKEALASTAVNGAPIASVVSGVAAGQSALGHGRKTAEDKGHINTRMVIRHASAEATGHERRVLMASSVP